MHQKPTEPREIAGVEGLRACVGQELGVSAWHDIDQAAISAFAEATGISTGSTPNPNGRARRRSVRRLPTAC